MTSLFAAARSSMVPAKRRSPVMWQSQAAGSLRWAVSSVLPGARSMRQGFLSPPAGSTCTRTTTARRCGTPCSRLRAGMASPR